MMNNIVGTGNDNKEIILITGNFWRIFLGKMEKQACFSFGEISHPETDFTGNGGKKLS